MSDPDRQRIARAFSRAGDYDRHARVQATVARRLAQDIAALELREAPALLEIGCGTGFLTHEMAGQGIAGNWLVTDIAPGMVERCRQRIGERPGTRFALLDGERDVPEGAGQFDLICSSLAMQWFTDPAAAVRRMVDWLAPGGVLMFTTLGEGTFAEWRAAHGPEGLAAGLRALRPAADWAAILPGAQAAPPRIDRHRVVHESGLDFLRSLKAIGAATADPGHAPLGPSAMRRVLRRFEQGGAAVSYEVITCHYRRQA